MLLNGRSQRAIPMNIRNGATVGESFVASNPPIEWITALCALGATVQHMVDETLQEQPLEEFVTQVPSANYQGFVDAAIYSSHATPFRIGDGVCRPEVPADNPDCQCGSVFDDASW